MAAVDHPLERFLVLNGLSPGQALKPVDRAILGSATDIYQTVVDVKPDLIALGFDQIWDEHEVEAECARRGVKVKVLRLPEIPHDHLATKRLVEKILDRARAAGEPAP